MATALEARSVGEDQVKAELLAVWDQFTPLSLDQLTVAYGKGRSLDEVGISAVEAESFVNKYNSIILRTPGDHELVRPSEARAWVSTPMNAIVAVVNDRASKTL